jgi:tryptophan-rich sensory protein
VYRNTAQSIVEKLYWIDNIVVYAWVILSILMIITLILLYNNKSNSFSTEVWLIFALLIATWTYPLYTLGYRLEAGLIGNILYGVFLVYVIIQVSKVLPLGTWLLLPTAIWITVATVYVIAQVVAR